MTCGRARLTYFSKVMKGHRVVLWMDPGGGEKGKRNSCNKFAVSLEKKGGYRSSERQEGKKIPWKLRNRREEKAISGEQQ